jgi:hypothetical protein
MYFKKIRKLNNKLIISTKAAGKIVILNYITNKIADKFKQLEIIKFLLKLIVNIKA